MIYLFVLLLAFQAANKSATVLRILSISLVLIVLLGNVRLANLVYLKKDYVTRANDSYFTRLLGRIESADGYKPGITPVVFAGNPDLIRGDIPSFANVERMTGAECDFILGTNSRTRYAGYLERILFCEIKIADADVWTAMQTDYRVMLMPTYPATGCVQIFDNVLVVKQGQTELEEFCPCIDRLHEYCRDSYQLSHTEGWYAAPQSDFLVCPVKDISLLGIHAGDKISVKPTYANIPPALPLYRRCMNSFLAIRSPITEMRKAVPLPGYAIQTPRGAYLIVRHNHDMPRVNFRSLELEGK